MSNLSMRLQQARKASGLSLRDLAHRVSISLAAIKKYEEGQEAPSSDILLKLAQVLKVRVDFFFRPVRVSLENVLFRKGKKLAKKEEEKIKMTVADQIERRLELESLYPVPVIAPLNLPIKFHNSISSLEEVEELAESLRGYWKLGQGPVHDLMDVFESHGIRVLIVDTGEKDFDGLFTVIDNHPIIVTCSRWSGDRQRFKLLHELACYILLDHLSSQLDKEKTLTRFVEAFLLPREAVFQRVGKKRQVIEWQELILLKEQFQVSIQTIFHRLKDLEIIKNTYYEELGAFFREKKWHEKEPGIEILPEKAHVFNQLLFHALAEEYIGESKAAELLACSLVQLKDLRQIKVSLEDFLGQNTYALTH